MARSDASVGADFGKNDAPSTIFLKILEGLDPGAEWRDARGKGMARRARRPASRPTRYHVQGRAVIDFSVG